MCMDDFVKKLYDFRGIEFFGVKIIIRLSKNHCDLILTVGFDLSQNSRYIYDIFDILPIYLQYIPIYLRYLSIFFQKFQHMCV